MKFEICGDEMMDDVEVIAFVYLRNGGYQSDPYMVVGKEFYRPHFTLSELISAISCEVGMKWDNEDFKPDIRAITLKYHR